MKRYTLLICCLIAGFLFLVACGSKSATDSQTNDSQNKNSSLVTSDNNSDENVQSSVASPEAEETAPSADNSQSLLQVTPPPKEDVQILSGEEENAVTFSDLTGKKGDILTGTLSVVGKVDLCAVDLNLTYDASKLKLTASEDTFPDLIVNADSANGCVRLNLVRVNNIKEAFSICRLTFEVLTDEVVESAVTIDVREMDRIDGDNIVDCPYTVHNGQVSLNR